MRVRRAFMTLIVV